MIAEIISYIREIKAVSKESFKEDSMDLVKFDDPLARFIKWGPLGPNGIVPPIQRLLDNGHGTLLSKKTILGCLVNYCFAYPLTFFSIYSALAVPVLFAFLLLKPLEEVIWVRVVLVMGLIVLLTIIFGVLAYHSLRYMGTFLVFDKKRGMFWKGLSIPLLSHLIKRPIPWVSCSLDAIQAVQVIKGKWSIGATYEFNLVLDNGQRVNLLSCGLAEPIKEDAQMLSDFLRVPLWDAIPDWMASRIPASQLPPSTVSPIN